ncbi:MAG TPA: pseudaminic acid synthase [Cytophagales bacterium]|nr:pseudaminic acid synthase [Cytophagales bacterium]HAA18396.1 pseudaminic acid synthase [Cytophagales bacterium]HAP61445.1 pseudaminic acid synthase [Cytophagales bacterium]
MQISGRGIGGDHPVFIIAELSANHQHKKQVAIDTIKAAKQTGADAIKLQTYTPDTITLNSKKEYFQLKQGTIWDGRNLYDLYEEAHLPWDWHQDLFEAADKEGLVCFSSPFDFTAVDLLESLNAPAYKIASFEIVDIPLIEKVAATGKPIIISTGIAGMEDIELALSAARKAGAKDIALLKCTSSYPAPIDRANLTMIKDFEERFDIIPGLSDHTLGITVPVVSVAMGAKVIEKHFILDKSIGGPDASFSLDVNEFTEMVNAVRDAEKSLGVVDYTVTDKMKQSREFSRSLFVTQPVKKGETFTSENVRSVRPNYGLHPKHYQEVLGKVATQDIEAAEPLSWEMIER